MRLRLPSSPSSSSKSNRSAGESRITTRSTIDTGKATDGSTLSGPSTRINAQAGLRSLWRGWPGLCLPRSTRRRGPFLTIRSGHARSCPVKWWTRSDPIVIRDDNHAFELRNHRSTPVSAISERQSERDIIRSLVKVCLLLSPRPEHLFYIKARLRVTMIAGPDGGPGADSLFTQDARSEMLTEAVPEHRACRWHRPQLSRRRVSSPRAQAELARSTSRTARSVPDTYGSPRGRHRDG